MSDAIAQLSAALTGSYRIERELGHGGMALVYLAHDLKHGRMVALKVLRPDLAAVLGPERFLAEVRTTAALQHPRILPLFDSGVASLDPEDARPSPGIPYYVMPYVEGETLRSRLDRERQLPIPEAIALATQVASALEYAHGRGVIHRDIKPENILLQSGEAVVADFGVALAIETAGGSRLTETGFAVGTAQYMSPEQAAGERTLDGRSDLYALGCVLYEMLAGEPPFSGATAQVIAAKRLTLPVPSVRAVREAVPPSVDAALTQVLAKAPADRFATAGALADALRISGETAAPIVQKPARHWPGRRVAAATLIGVLCLAAMGVMLALGRAGRATALDMNLLAVAPFDVTGAGLDVWREGVVDLLSRTLDGAGSLRTVSPSVILRGWSGHSDRASAQALGRRTGAGVVTTGNLTQLGPGRVRLRATLLDIRTDEQLGEVEVEGAPDALGELSDSLGLGILRTLSRTRPVAAVRQAAITSAPLGALKAFLVGEQAYRRGDYDSALVAYQEAVTQDSNFVLALSRMGQALSWEPPTAPKYDSLLPFRALRMNHGLPARESLLLAADSAAHFGSTEDLETLRLASARYHEAVRRYPADPEAWYALGEFLAHADNPAAVLRNISPFEAFERALELDPGFAPAYEHVIGMALTLGREDRALHHARLAADLASSAKYSNAVRLVSRLLLLPEASRPGALAAEINKAPGSDLFDVAMESFIRVPDTNETAVYLFRRLAALTMAPGEGAEHVVDSAMRRRYVAVALARRGHLRDAVREIPEDLSTERSDHWWRIWQDPFAYLALLGAIPREQVAPVFARALLPGIRVENPFQRKWRGAPWWAAEKDTASLALFERRMREAAVRDRDRPEGQRARFLEREAGGFLALTRGDTSGALERFASVPDSLYIEYAVTPYVRLTEAALLAARGEDATARPILDQWSARLVGVLAVFARLQRAKVAEHQGDTATARRDYQHVSASWRTADPEFARYVAEANAGLARLGNPRR